MKAGVVTGLAAEARLASGLGLVLAGGGTVAGAERAAALLLRQGATCLVSFGLAGGLDPALRPGTLIVPDAVIDAGVRFATDPVLAGRLGRAAHGSLATAEQVLATPAQKHAWRVATGAAAVDLESGAVARAAYGAQIPFAVLRAICDPAGRSLPPAALLALDAAGVVRLGRVLRSLAVRPGQLPALLALARDAARARAALVRRVGDVRRLGGLVG